jgi:hypothetical protein
METQDRKNDSSAGCLIHLFWLLLGNIMLLVVAGQLFSGGGKFSWLDILYWLLVFLILLARYADIRYFKGATIEGRPSSMQDWRRHALILILLAGLAWIAIHLWGFIYPSLENITWIRTAIRAPGVFTGG